MKIFIAGATGRVAEFLMKDLLEEGYEIIAGARSPEKVPQHEKVTPVHLDLGGSLDEITELVKGTNAIYFTAGSRGKDLLQTDAFGAVRLMQAAEQAGVKRFIMLSSIFATEPEKWAHDPVLSGITDYNIAKFFADSWLIRNTDLDYTIVQPSVLVEAEEGSGKINVAVTESTPNTIPNVARVLAAVLNHQNTVYKVIPMGDGETPIEQALDTL